MLKSKEIANALYKIDAIQIRPDRSFVWTSGIHSPIYCDNRLTMSYPKVRKQIVRQFAEMIEQLEEKPDVIAGCATAGIPPHAAWLADYLDLPMVYVRATPKGHGKQNQIEGKVEKGDKVIVIEDLISTGGSSIESAIVLQDAGAEVLQVLAIFTYGLAKADKKFKEVNVTFSTITNFDILADALVENNEITEAEKTDLLQWRDELGNS
ncbi:orotate phosphoribosyltransferase [Gracilibacillus boraciitolerans JCM 21714]|uniref:Orotate phosphoribosyltransferase n=1 Tax=Gracilibacillus boraciitolerans JCM 21714 TaxID=1298598 RepID=W4VE51_9BACI|nr:orotate phosphoribosyltransferase [Gracilibacillus boraciitolerans]GAE91695.1 orotate phosphoribosyltransferase [Gracilibacillus boraciitolerans JCM 21714]